jgi:hypothetical protein
MEGPYTTACFEVGGISYIAVATYVREQDDPWHVHLTKDNRYERFVGNFDRVEDGWIATKQLLGISQDIDMPRTSGEETDGGPFSHSDFTHKR